MVPSSFITTRATWCCFRSRNTNASPAAPAPHWASSSACRLSLTPRTSVADISIDRLRRPTRHRLHDAAIAAVSDQRWLRARAWDGGRGPPGHYGTTGFFGEIPGKDATAVEDPYRGSRAGALRGIMDNPAIGSVTRTPPRGNGRIAYNCPCDPRPRSATVRRACAGERNQACRLARARRPCASSRTCAVTAPSGTSVPNASGRAGQGGRIDDDTG